MRGQKSIHFRCVYDSYYHVPFVLTRAEYNQTANIIAAQAHIRIIIIDYFESILLLFFGEETTTIFPRIKPSDRFIWSYLPSLCNITASL